MHTPWAVDVHDHYHRVVAGWLADGVATHHRLNATDVEFDMFGYTFFLPQSNPLLIKKLLKLQHAWTTSIHDEYSKQHPKLAYYFAVKVLKRRWEAAEQYICQDAFWAYKYARDVIGGRWEAAEPAIYANGFVLTSYLAMIAAIEQAQSTNPST